MRKFPFARLLAPYGLAALLVSSSGCQLLANFDRSLIDGGADNDAMSGDDASEPADGSVDAPGPGTDASDAAPGTDASDAALPEDASDSGPLEDANDGASPTDASDASDGSTARDASDGSVEQDASDGSTEQDASDASKDQDANDGASSADASDAASEVDASDAASEVDASDAGCTTAAQCDDHNACTTDSCGAGGICVNAPLACTNGDQCNGPGTCNPGTGLCSTPVPVTNGTGCSDGNACTQTDTCQAGVCTGANPIACTNGDQCNGAGTCNPGTGKCSAAVPVTNGTGCNDGNACTQTDTCQAGVCAGTNPIVCTNGDQCNSPGACDTGTGKCSLPVPVTNGTGCNDGNACTKADTCQAGACAGASPIVCTNGDQCNGAGTCNPGTGVCSAPVPVTDGTTCNDSDVCTQTDQCESGSCTGSNPQTCSTGFSCNATKGCVSTPLTTAAITEFQAFATTPPNVGQFIEIQNPAGGAAGDLANGTLTDGTSTVTIHPATDPTGTNKGTLIVAPGAYVWGVANPTTPAQIPAGASFVWGDPGTTYALNQAGPKMVLANAASVVLATVDASAFVTGATQTVAAGSFPGSASKSTQWDATLGAATDGSNWCLTFHGADTRGATNQGCGGEVINEVLEHFATPGVGIADDSSTFIEIASPGGANLGGIALNYIANNGSVASTATIPPGTRANVLGLYVIADGNTNGGTTNVPNANLVLGAGTPLDGSAGGVALVLMPATGTTPLDSFGYGAGGPNAEGTPLASVTPLDIAISYARDASSTDTNVNSADFHYDPSPTPGAPNTAVSPALVSASVSDGLDSVATPVTFDARDVADVAAFNGVAPAQKAIVGSFAGQQDAACVITAVAAQGRGDATVTCTAPTNAGTPARGDLSLASPTGLGLANATLTNDWTYTGVNNGTSAMVNFCQTDTTTSAATAQAQSPALLGEIFQSGVTENGEGAGLIGQLGIGPAGSDPTTTAGWTFTDGSYVGQIGTGDHNNQFSGSVLAPSTGATIVVPYAWRFSFDDGLTYSYCDTQGNGSNGGLASFDPTKLGQLSVSP